MRMCIQHWILDMHIAEYFVLYLQCLRMYQMLLFILDIFTVEAMLLVSRQSQWICVISRQEVGICSSNAHHMLIESRSRRLSGRNWSQPWLANSSYTYAHLLPSTCSTEPSKEIPKSSDYSLPCWCMGREWFKGSSSAYAKHMHETSGARGLAEAEEDKVDFGWTV